RLGDVADARLEVAAALTATRSASPPAASVVTPPRPASWRRALPWAITAILGVGWILVLGRWGPWRTPSPPHAAQRLSVGLGGNRTLPGDGGAFWPSPGGTLPGFCGADVRKNRAT